MNEWMNEWMNESMNELSNYCIDLWIEAGTNKWKHTCIKLEIRYSLIIIVLPCGFKIPEPYLPNDTDGLKILK
jgi:hypothetical protein